MASSKNNTAVRGSNGDGEKGEANLSQDVEWLSSLSESELDFFIGLKELAIRRAKNAGCKDLAEKFDARMLRALGIVLMEHFKAQAESASITTNVLETSALLRDCNLETPNCEKNLGSVTFSEDVRTSSFVTPRRKRMWEGLCEERASSSKKRKTARKDSMAVYFMGSFKELGMGSVVEHGPTAIVDKNLLKDIVDTLEREEAICS